MITIDEAVAIVKANVTVPAAEESPLDHALGRTLAEDILAPEPSPRYTNSAMDGYAVRWADVQGISLKQPVSLVVIGESRAGMPFSGAMEAGQAVRISTGAMLPDGADTVIRVEDTREQGESVIVSAAKRRGQDVRHEGEEFGPGVLLLAKGSRIAPPQAALLASVGITQVPVYRSCTAALLVTGSELVATGASIARHQIRDSNMIMLRAAVEQAGARLTTCARIVDDREVTARAIGEAQADIILCAGGVSVGPHDHVKEAAEANGFTPLFWRIRQKPGKPLYFARKGNTLLFGLPGNPVSAFMCFTHYVRPLIAAFAGQPFAWPTVSAQVATDITNTGKRTTMVRARRAEGLSPHGWYVITNVEQQGSHMLTSLTEADGYIILEPGQKVQTGDRIEVYRF